MKVYQRGLMARGLMALVIAATATGALSAHAATVSIPWSAALQMGGNSPADECVPYSWGFGSSNECYVDFPLSLPVGTTIQQISVLHLTDNMFPGGQPFIQAYLAVNTLTPAYSESDKFGWESTNPLPTGTFERHPLMAQVLKTYPDQFQIAPFTVYHVLVALQNGAGIASIEVTYN